MYRERDADWKRWALLSGLFLFMSADEASAIHEILIRPLRTGLGLSGILYFSWVVPAIVLVGALAIFLAPFLVRLPRLHAVRFVGCGAVFLGGALGMELFSGYLASRYGMEHPRYRIAALIEESMEIAGSTLFCAALLAYLRDRFGAWTLRVA